jgi:hypothetical protein
MTPQFSAGKFPYSKISIYKNESFELVELASFFAGLSCDCAAVFDRSMWTQLSSGQMPSQLFPFPGQSVNNCAAVFHNKPLSFKPSQEISVSSVNCSGQPGECFEVEDDFEEAMFLMFLKSDKVPDLETMMVYNLETDIGPLQICAGYNLYPADEWLENFDDPDGNYFFAPSFELRSELIERVEDKEKIHLDKEIRGVYL